MIKSLHLKGLQSHTDSSLEFTPGVNVILGETNAGKTAVIRALQWIFQNRPLGAGLTQRDAKECVAEVSTDAGSASRIRRRGFNGYVVNGVEYKEIGSSVPDELQSVINLRDVNLQEQLQPHFLITQPAGQISKYVADLLGFDVIDRVLSAVKSGLTSIKSEASRIRAEIDAADQELARYEDLDTLSSLLDQAHSLEREQVTLKAKILAVSNCVAQISQASRELNAMTDELGRIDAPLSSLASLIDDLDDKAASVREVSDYVSRLSRVVEQLDSCVSYVSRVSINLHGLDEVLSDADAAMLEFVSAIQNRQGITDCIQSVSSHGSQRDAYKADVDLIESKIEEAKNEYVELFRQEGTCPVCLGVLGPDHIESLAGWL